MQHVETRLVGGIPGSLHLHAAERSHRDVTVRLAAPRAAPMFHLGQFAGRFLDKQINRILVAQPIATGNGIVEMVVEAVIVAPLQLFGKARQSGSPDANENHRGSMRSRRSGYAKDF